jgi:hypothetical protein
VEASNAKAGEARAKLMAAAAAMLAAGVRLAEEGSGEPNDESALAAAVEVGSVGQGKGWWGLKTPEPCLQRC